MTRSLFVLTGIALLTLLISTGVAGAAPVVTGISPTGGPEAGGTAVTVTGTGFTGTTFVMFGSSPAASFTVDSDTGIAAVSPAGSAGTVDITVTTFSGTSPVSAADQFTYSAGPALPAVTGISPASGPVAGGTSVTITGTDFTGATAVQFGSSAAASFTVDSGTQITAVSPAASAGTVDITVTTPAGTSAVSAADQFTYVAAPVLPAVTGISPSSGPVAGGTSVTITGTDFTGASAVQFGSSAAASFTVDSGTQITAVSPAASAGTVDITVTTPAGTSAVSAADQFTYVAAPVLPAVTGISPSSGPVAGDTSVTITGTAFTGATAVQFGSSAAASFTVVSGTQITAVSPAASAGTVDITVTTPAGTSTTSAADQFTYAAAPVSPAVTGISPASGPVAGGTSVTITGTAFTGATAVKFGAVNASSFTVNSGTQITAVSPAGSAGSVDITVTTPAGTSTTSAADQFTYVAAPALPAVTGISPASGPVAGGTSVTITGTAFTGATAVKFGAVGAVSFTVVSGTQITAVSPAGSAGSVDITVTTPAGTSTTTDADRFTYVAPGAPVITGISPAHGSVAGGTTVVISGSGFTGATAVKFGSSAAASFTVDSDTRITAVSPAGSLGSVHVTVTTKEGTSALSAADRFLYGASDEEPLSATLTIRPTTLNTGSRGVFTVYITLAGDDSPFPVDGGGKPRVDFSGSYLACSGAEMISTGVSNKNGGTLIAKFHRQDLENVTGGDGVGITCSGTLSINGKLVDVEGSDTIRVIAEKKGLDRIFSDIMRYLGLNKDAGAGDDSAAITPSVTLDPDTFRNAGQMKKALRTVTTEPTGTGQADTTRDQKQDNGNGKGNGKDNRDNDRGKKDTTPGNSPDNGNKKNDDKGSNGNSNGKKNK